MTIDTGQLLDELQVAVRRDAARGRRRRRLIAAAAGLVTALVAGVGIAGTYDNWWAGAEPPVQPQQVQAAMDENDGLIDVDLSKKATVARTDDAALVAVATKSGGFCMSLFLSSGRGLGSSCDSTPVRDDGTGSTFMTRADDSHWIAYGRITDAGAAALDLAGAGLPARVPLERGGFFLLDIPKARWHALDARTGDVSILDAGGTTIRAACIYVGIAPGSPYAGEGGLGDGPGECARLAPVIPEPQLDRAKRLVTLTLTRPYGIYSTGDTIALWAAPNKGGGTCILEGLADAKPATRGAGFCSRDDGWLGGKAPMTVSASSTLHDGGYENLASGFVKPGSGIARVDLVGAGRTIHAALGGNAFLAELPTSPKVGKGPGPIPGGPYRVVGYGADGREVASAELRGSLGG